MFEHPSRPSQISYSSAAQFRLMKKISSTVTTSTSTISTLKSQEDTASSSNNPETLKRTNSSQTRVLNCIIKTLSDDRQQYYLSRVKKDRHNPNSPWTKHLTLTHKLLKKFQDLTSKQSLQQLILPQDKRYHNKKTLLLDLDQTLIHSTKDPSPSLPCDLRLPIVFPNNKTMTAGIHIRPFAIPFLQSISKHFEIIIFTAGHQFYADPILDALDPDNVFFSHRLYRQHCIELAPDVYAKDLTVVNRNLSQTVIVDNSPVSYVLQPENGVPIISFYGADGEKGEGERDEELRGLEEYLMRLVYLVDVKNMNARTWRFGGYRECEDIGEVIERLYGG